MFTLTLDLTEYESALWPHRSQEFREGYACGLTAVPPDPACAEIEVYACVADCEGLAVYAHDERCVWRRVVHGVRVDGGRWLIAVSDGTQGANVENMAHEERQLRLL